MKYLIMIFVLSFNVFAEQDCATAGDKAEEIMKKRQVNDNLLEVLKLYEEYEDIVFDAYDVPRYDSLEYLLSAVDARSMSARADYKRKAEEVEQQYKSAVSQFKNKYIKKCLIENKARN